MAVDLLPTKVKVSEDCLSHESLSGFREGAHVSILCLSTFLSNKTWGIQGSLSFPQDPGFMEGLLRNVLPLSLCHS